MLASVHCMDLHCTVWTFSVLYGPSVYYMDLQCTVWTSDSLHSVIFSAIYGYQHI
jgi:hypothetical protein